MFLVLFSFISVNICFAQVPTVPNIPTVPSVPTVPNIPTPPAGEQPAPGSDDAASSGGLVNAGKVPLNNPLTDKPEPISIFTILNNVITAGLGLTGILALIAFIYGGVLWMISLGDAGKVEKGKKMMIWAVVGLAVVFTSYGAITLLFRAFGVAGV